MTRTILVTGASRGIGRACALLAAERGDNVIVHYGSEEALAAGVVERIRAFGVRSVALRAELNDLGAVERLYARIDSEFGPPDAVINNAAIGFRASSVTAADPSGLASLFNINVLSLMLSCGEAVKRMARSRGGRGGVIINVSSMAATIGGRPGSAHYAASKAAVDAFTVGLAKEVAAEGIRAISVRPGMVETEQVRSALQQPQFAATIRESIPLGRPATLDEVARPIVFLLSDDASFITGACIDISGGGFHIARAPG